MSQIPLPSVRRIMLGALLDALAASAPAEDGHQGQPCPSATLQSDYARGVADTLILLGALRDPADDGALAAVSPQAGWVIAMLRAFLDLDAPVVDDWHSRGVALAGTADCCRAVDLLASLEARRQILAPGAPPLREVAASVGLISRRGGVGAAEILLVYDVHARAWQLPGGSRDHADPTPEATLLRELHEELGLPATPAPGSLVLEALPSVSETRISPTYGLATRAAFNIYRVSLAAPYLPAQPDQRWVSLAELEAGRTADGMQIAVGPLHGLATQLGLSLAQILAET